MDSNTTNPNMIDANDLESKYLCSVCLDVLEEPVTLECSHTFCKVCFDKFTKRSMTCPNCRCPIEQEWIRDMVEFDMLLDHDRRADINANVPVYLIRGVDHEKHMMLPKFQELKTKYPHEEIPYIDIRVNFEDINISTMKYLYEKTCTDLENKRQQNLERGNSRRRKRTGPETNSSWKKKEESSLQRQKRLKANHSSENRGNVLDPDVICLGVFANGIWTESPRLTLPELNNYYLELD